MGRSGVKYRVTGGVEAIGPVFRPEIRVLVGVWPRWLAVHG